MEFLMSNIIMLPSLSEDGWVKSTQQLADYMLTHFFLSEKSQTFLYGSSVSSLQFIIQDNAGNMLNTVTAVQTALTTYFGRYFTNVVADCNSNDINVNGTSVNLNIFVSFTDSDGISYSLGKIVTVADAKIKTFATINNG
jgi:hypothetical protein